MQPVLCFWTIQAEGGLKVMSFLKIFRKSGRLFFNLPNCNSLSRAWFEGFAHFTDLCALLSCLSGKKRVK